MVLLVFQRGMVGIKDIFAQFYELAVVLAAFAFLQSHQALYVCIQLFGYERLLYIVVGSGSIACLQVFRRGKACGKEDDGIAIYLPYFPHHLQTVHDRHVYIRYDDIGLKGFPFLQSLPAIDGSLHLISFDDIFEAAFLHIGEVFVVFYQE